MSDRHIAIYNTHSDVVMIDDKMGALDKDGNSIALDEDKIKNEMKRRDEEWDSQAYERNRKVEYPDLAEQLDYIYHNGIAKWKSDMIKPVKDKYPKG